jgi:ligand-binding SRPBCC domain-containing protein
MERLELSTIVHADIQKVWEFYHLHDNILLLAPPENEVRIIHPPLPLFLEKDMVIDYKIKNPLGNFTDWKAKITDFDPPHFLADEQVEGPFEYWRQEYSFRVVANGTEVKNTLYYIPLWGKLGMMLDVVFVQNMLIDLLEYRSARMKELLNH